MTGWRPDGSSRSGSARVTSRNAVRERFPDAAIVGVDLPDEELAGDWRAAGLACLFGDATRLPVPDGAVDLVLAIEVLEHIPAPDAALAELARVCSRHAGGLGAVRADLAGREPRPRPLRP